MTKHNNKSQPTLSKKNATASSNRKRKASSSGKAPPAKKAASCSASSSNNLPNVTITDRKTPFKSVLDQNDYRVIKLSNDMTIALISQPDPILQWKPSKVAKKLRSQLYENHPNLDAFTQPLGEIAFSKNCLYPHTSPTYHSLPYTADNKNDGNDLDSIAGQLLSKMGIGKAPSTKSKTDTSMSLAVSFGGMDDPLSHQGLAHFMEHMVHYGSKKFPEVHEGRKLTATLGYSNAMTLPELTVYYNEVPDHILETNLERYTDMLTNPLFCRNMLKREVNAVDNEFYLKSPYFVKQLLITVLALRDPDHPLGSFIWGNLKTLSNCDGANGDRAQCVMSCHHKNHYVGSGISLCINSQKSLEEMETLALKYFSGFPNGKEQLLHQAPPEKTPPPLRTCKKGSLNYTYLKGTRSWGELTFVWTLWGSHWDKTDKNVTLDVITALLNDSSVGTLQESLMQQGLIFSAYADAMPTSYATMIQLEFFLTPTGQANTEQIANELYSYIKILEKATENEKLMMQRYFNELKTSNLSNFHYGEPEDGLGKAMTCSINLQTYSEVEEMLRAESWTKAEFCFKKITEGLNQMLLWNENLIVIETVPKQNCFKKMIKSVGGGDIQTARYTEAKYVTVLKPLPPGNKQCLNFPKENRFLEKTNECASSSVPTPPPNVGDIPFTQMRYKSKGDRAAGSQEILKISGLHFGHDKDDGMETFLGGVEIRFISTAFFESPRTSILTFVWLCVIMNSMNKYLTQLRMAGIEFMINSGLSVAINGPAHPHQFLAVAKAAISSIFDREITEKEFQFAKSCVSANLELTTSSNSFIINNITVAVALPTLINDSWFDVLGQIDDLTLNDLTCLICAFKKNSRCRVDLEGNVPLNLFDSIAEMLDKKDFGPQQLNQNRSPLQDIRRQPPNFLPGEKCIRVRSRNDNGYTTSVSNLYIVDKVKPINSSSGEHDFIRFLIVLRFMKSHAFQFLRTEHQLGYAVRVNCNIILFFAHSLYAFSIKVSSPSHKFTACEINQKIDEFVAGFGDSLTNLDEQLWKAYLEMVPTLPRTLTRESMGTWFNSKFGNDFAKDMNASVNKCLVNGIQKISIQVFPGNPEATIKLCKCEKCSNIEGWVPSQAVKPTLEYARGKGAMKKYFVNTQLK